jgi:ribosome biogenesis protein ERB1
MYDAINFSHSGHEESYNPSVEYVPTQEEIDSYQLLYEEDRPKFIPRRYSFDFLF